MNLSAFHLCREFASECDSAGKDMTADSWRERAESYLDHASSCARHNMPAYPNGPCDCGAVDRALVSKDSGDAERDALLAVARAALRYRNAEETWLNTPAGSDEHEMNDAEHSKLFARGTLDEALAALPAGWDK